MLSIGPQTAIYIAVSPVDFRLGIDGLAQYCRSVLMLSPMKGALFVFRNRKRTAIKIVTYDGQGFILLHKRLSQGRLHWWPTSTSTSQQVLARDLHILFYNGDPIGANMADDWRAIIPPAELSSSIPFVDNAKATKHGDHSTPEIHNAAVE